MAKIPVYWKEPQEVKIRQEPKDLPSTSKILRRKIELIGNVDAGAEVFPGGFGHKVWLHSIIMTVSTGAGVATRIPSLYLQFSDPTTFIDLWLYPANITATTAVTTIIWDHSGAVGASFHTEWQKLPDIALSETDRLRVGWVGDQIGDTLELLVLFEVIS